MNKELSTPLVGDNTLRKVAREVAMDLLPLETILNGMGVSVSEFEKIKGDERFKAYLQAYRQEWATATNTFERTKIKSGLVLEDYVEQAYRDIHNVKLPLNHRVELGKMLSKLAGMGEATVVGAGGGGFTLSININQSEKVTIKTEKEKVIDHDPSDFSDIEDVEVDDGYDPFTSPVTITADL